MTSRQDRFDLLVGRWWLDRDPVELARSTIEFVDRLRGLDALLAEWVIPTGAKASSLRNQFSTDRPAEEVAASAMWDPEVPGFAPIFMFDIWNGRDGWSGASVRVTSVLLLSQPLPAKAFLQLPHSFPKASVQAAFRAMVETFRPDNAGLASPTTQNELSDDRAPGPLLFLSRERYARPDAQPGLGVEEVGTQGWLIEADDWDLTMAADDQDDAIRRLGLAIETIAPPSGTEITAPAQANVIRSDSGYFVEVLGPTGLRYGEGHRTMRINSEWLIAPASLVVYAHSIAHWDDAPEEQVEAQARDRILSNIRAAFRSQGHEIQVMDPERMVVFPEDAIDRFRSQDGS